MATILKMVSILNLTRVLNKKFIKLSLLTISFIIIFILIDSLFFLIRVY